MNAYYYFHAHAIAAEAAALNRGRYVSQQSTRLTEPQLEFLNSDACQHVNPYSKNFWPELTDWLADASQLAEALPQASGYRHALAPYLLRRAHLTAETWSFREIGENRIHLLLKNVRLSNVYERYANGTPDAVVDHLNIWVSTAWFNRAAPACGEPLAVDGVLYEYAGSKQVRNIGLWPVLVMPLSRKSGGFWKNSAARPDTILCPGRAA